MSAIPEVVRTLTELKMDTELMVSEVFGPTFQGEGPSAGRRCGFIRLGHCNLHCVWCDADYTWAYSEGLPNLGYTQKVYDPKEELRKWKTSELVSAVEEMNVRMVVITGGEPLLQAKSLAPLVESLKDQEYRIEVETNGTLTPAKMYGWWMIDQWNISPKLANSHNTIAERYKPKVWEWYLSRIPDKSVFKFVVAGQADMEEVEALVLANHVPSERIWIMPEGVSQTDIGKKLESVVPWTLANGWNLTLRQQVTIWGDKRGV